MTFLNATLMLGIAAAALPVILHLMGRKEPKKVVFPAVRFLSRRIETQRSRLRIRRWWLLALRVLALCALAIGLAGPIIDRSVSVAWLSIAILCSVAIGLLVMAGLAVTRAMSRSTIGGLLATASLVFVGAFAWAGYTLAVSPTALANASAPVAVVFVIDNAPTAAWQNTEGVSRLDRMKQAANAIISGLAETSRIGIVDRSGTPAAFSLDRSGAISRLSGLGIRQAPVPLAPRLEAAIRLASVSELSVRRVIVLTDLARASWSGDLASESLLTTRKLDSRNDSGSIPITVFDIGPPQSTNRRLHAVQYFDSTPPKGTPVPISVSISHTGAPPTEPEEVTAELRVYKSDPSKPVIRNGEIVRPEAMAKDRTSAKVSPDGESEVTLTIPSLSLGSHHAEIRLIGKDAFPLDDATYMTLQVLPPSHGLIVTDRPEDGYYLQLAIAVPFAIDDPDAEYQMQLVSSEDFSAAELGEFDVVVLLDPPSGLVADPRLDRFVREGGTAVVFLGPSIEADSIQLPLMPTLRRRWRVADPGTFYRVTAGDHPVFAAFEGMDEKVRWSDFRVHQYWQLGPASESDRILARYAGTDHIAVLQRTVGNGSLLTFTTPLPDLESDARWNNFFGVDNVWPAWFLLKQVVEHASRRKSDAESTLVGQPLVIELPTLESRTASMTNPMASSRDPDGQQNVDDTGVDAPVTEDAVQRWQLFAPEMQTALPLTADRGADRIAITAIDAAGTHWLRGAGGTTGFSANIDPKWHLPDRIDPATLDEWFGADAYQLAEDPESIQVVDSDSAPSVSLRSPVMLFAMAVFLLEQVLGNRFYRKQQAVVGAPQRVAA